MAKAVDANQKDIVTVARQMGASVCLLHETGGGVPDLLVGFRGNNYLWEVKDGEKILSKQKLTADQIIFHNSWRGQVATINSTDAVIAFLNMVARISKY